MGKMGEEGVIIQVPLPGGVIRHGVGRARDVGVPGGVCVVPLVQRLDAPATPERVLMACERLAGRA